MSDVRRTNRNLDELHPKVRELAKKLLEEAKKEGLNIGISETYRSPERQDYLYAQGRTRPGRIVTYVRGSAMASYHQWRLAFDVYNNVRGNEYNHQVLKKVGAIGQRLGLEWGGGWSRFKDSPHFQYTFGLSIRDLKNGKRPPSYMPETIEEKAERTYKEVVEYLFKQKLLSTPAAWYPVPSSKYFDALLQNLMPSVVGNISYEYQIKFIKQLGIIASTRIWLNKDFREPYMKIVINRIVDIMQSEDGREPKKSVVDEYKDSIDFLTDKKILSSPEAWYPIPSAKYFEILINKLVVMLMAYISYEEQIKLLKMIGVIDTTKGWLEKDFKQDQMKDVIQKLSVIIKND